MADVITLDPTDSYTAIKLIEAQKHSADMLARVTQSAAMDQASLQRFRQRIATQYGINLANYNVQRDGQTVTLVPKQP